MANKQKDTWKPYKLSPTKPDHTLECSNSWPKQKQRTWNGPAVLRTKFVETGREAPEQGGPR